MCVGDVRTQPTGAPYPACASGLSTRSVTPGAPRALSACWRHVASNPARIEFVPMTVMGFPLSPGAGMKPVASPVAWIWVGLVSLISNSCVQQFKFGHAPTVFDRDSIIATALLYSEKLRCEPFVLNK